jgi:hypothetical protein
MKAIILFFTIMMAGFGSCGKVQATVITEQNTLTFQTWDVQHYSTSGWHNSITAGWSWSCINCGTTNAGTVQRTTISSDETVIFVYLLDSMGNMVISEPGATYTYEGTPAHYTTAAEMNVAGTGSSYAFIYQGNTSDYAVVQGIKTGDYWKCVNCSNGQTIYGRVVSVTDNGNGFFYVYLADNAGVPVLPESGKSYVYSDTSLAQTLPTYVTVGNGTQPVMNFGSNSAITIQQQTNVDLWTNRIILDGNKIYIDQVSGSNNNVTMDQDGNKNLIRAKIDGSSNSITARQGVSGVGQNEIKINTVGDSNTLNINQARTTQGFATGTNGHYQAVDINGSNNTLTTQQSNSGGVGGQYMETTINGNQNSVTAKQTDNGNKIMFNSITGNNNSIDAVQKGTGQHYLENKLTGNGNSVSAVQEGSTANRATLDLTNAGGPASVILQQNGGMNVTVTTTCATAGGCAPITVRQGY